MGTRNKRIRFCYNNFVTSSSTTKTYSSETSPNVGANILEDSRWDVWTFDTDGFFTIDSTNNKIYINDGSDKTVTLSSGTYTRAALGTEIQTQLNASSSNWSVTTVSPIYTFNITNTGSVTLRFSQTSNAAWDTLGYTGTGDTTSTSFEADEIRVHGYDYLDLDLGTSQEVTFLAIIGPLDEPYTLSTSSVVTLQGNSINDFSSPPFETTVTRTTEGHFAFIDDPSVSTTYRYWRIKIQDRTNSSTSNGFKIGYVYLGDHITLTQRNVVRGFKTELEDTSEEFKSDYGSKFYRLKSKHTKIDNITLPFLNSTDKDTFDQFVYDVGKTEPWFISLDPTLVTTTDLSKLTKYVRFRSIPTSTQVKTDTYTVTFDVEEVI